MPIRLNLLAEAQALEELRRRDPVKRVIWGAVCVVSLLLAWAASLQFQTIIGRMDLNRMDARLASHTNAFRLVLDNQKKLTDANQKLSALRQFSANRFLQGSLLNALQQAAMPDVQLTRFRSEQTYVLTEDTKPGMDAENRPHTTRTSTATERILLSLEARDTTSPNPGDQVNQFKKAIMDCPYFLNALGKTNEPRLVNLSPPRTTAEGKPFVSFALECRFPDKTR
ncbi:MAG: hypothetical protein ACLQVX_19130 [Limisphaerales bacterium]